MAKRRNVVIAVVVAVIAFAVAAAALLMFGARDDMEPNVIVGSVPGKSQDEVMAELQAKLDESMIGFTIETSMTFERGDAQGAISFENPAGNGKLLRLTITRDDTGEEVYRSGFVEPGSYVGSDQLDVNLPAGTYTCTALIEGYTLDDRRYLGAAAAGITVTVQS